ncbi:MAG: copper homeostasis periplasmic binding protein CopC [Acetobacteraceae bacterium]|nr:copper homeostasis periplasmic binding protein CopC [Acetobacteraceae bacterium]
MMRTVSFAAICFAACTAAGVLPALAHAHLQSAVPPVGGTVSAAPTEVQIKYSEGVEPRFCSVAVTNAGGARVDAGAAHIASGDNTRLIVPLKPLSPGIYHVEWHATAVDTHKTEGKFDFTVQP